MDTVHLDEGLLPDHRAQRAGRLLRVAAGRALGGGRDLRPDRQRARSAASRWASPICSSTWCSRAPSGAPPASWRWSSRCGAAASTPTPARDHTSYQAHVARRRSPAGGRHPHRPGPPAAAARERPRARAERDPGRDQRGGGHAGRSGLRAPRRDALARPSLRLFHPRHAGDARAALARTTSAALHRTGYYRGNCVIAAAGNVDHGQLLERRWSGRAGSRAGSREPARRPVVSAPAQRGAAPARGARHRPDPHGVRHRHLPAPGSPALRARDPDQRLRRRHVEPAVPAGPGGAGPGLRRLRLQEVLPERRAARRVRRHPDRQRRRRRSRRSGPSTTGWRARACRPTSWPTASSSSRGRSCCRWRARSARMGRLAGIALHEDRYRPLDRDAGRDRRGDRGRCRRGGRGVLPGRAADGRAAGTGWIA